MVLFDLALFKKEISVILEGPDFARSKANRALLTYLADEVEAGRAEKLNEYAIAQDLLGRSADFDPTTDPLVRVRMQRLRKALEAHYQRNSKAPHKITLPRGQYVLQLDVTQSAPVTAQKAQNPSQQAMQDMPEVDPLSGYVPFGRLVLMASSLAAAIVLVCGALIYLALEGTANSPERQASTQSVLPVVAIAPFENLTGVSENDLFEVGFQRQLATDFQKFDRAKIKVLKAAGSQELSDVDYVVSGRILSLQNGVDLSIELRESPTGLVVSTRRIKLQNDHQDYAEALSAWSNFVSGQLAGQGGVLSNAVQNRLNDALGLPHQGNLGVFRCAVLTDKFLYNQETDNFLSAYDCFESHAERVVEFPTIAASWGKLRLHAVPELKYFDVSDLPPRYHEQLDTVFAYAENISRRFPSSEQALTLLGSVHLARKEPRQAAQALKLAVELNPANVSVLAMYSYALLAVDDVEGAKKSALRVLDRTYAPSPFHHLPALVGGLATDDKEVVLAAFEGSKGSRSDVSKLVRLAAASYLELPDEVAQLSSDFNETGLPLEALRRVAPGDKAFVSVTRHLWAETGDGFLID